MRNIITACVLCLFMATVASARGVEERKVVLGVQVGSFSPSNDKINGIDTKSGTSFAIDVKYFINNYIGVGGYLFSTNFDTKDIMHLGNKVTHEISSSMIGISAVGRYPIKMFDFYALAGVGMASNDLKQKEGHILNEVDDNSISFRGEIGVNAQISRHFGLGVSTGIITNEMDVRYNTGTRTEKLGGSYVNLNFAWFF